ncbi:MAG: SurA N-terminal domain-containing protein [Muribaculaceae bacterium]|nr:SurA N-terminal domain-containing protein [Muribaculaceae bacterium]
MATLEKIRQRKKILAIVIGAALIAFIIEVGIEALGRQASNSTAAKVGSEKIDIMAFQQREQKEAAKDQNNPKAQQLDQATRQQQVLNDMINEKLLENEYEAAGIYVTDNEISELMIGKNAAPQAVQFAQQAGAETPAQLYDFLSNPAKQGVQESQVAELRAAWEDLKNELVDQYKITKLQMLIAGGLQANDLDRQMMAEDEATTCYVNFVKKDLASLPDDKYPVSDQELKAEWEKMKSNFAIDEETRIVHYIATQITPSPADIIMANKVADAAYAALQRGTGIDSVRVLGTVKIDTARYATDKVPANLKAWANGASLGATRRDSTAGPNMYRMYKVTNRLVSLDSVQINVMAIPGAKSTQDSALAMLNSGKTIDDVAKAIKGAQGDTAQWVQIVSYPDSLKNKLAAAGAEYFSLVSNAQGAQLVKVVQKKAPKTFVTIATVTHEAYASQKTIDDTRNKLQDFLNANKTPADFEKNAAKAGFSAIEAAITPSTPQLGQSPYGGGIKDSRKAIKWAFDNKKGAVSPIFSDNNDYFIAVALNEVYDGGYLPYDASNVKPMLTNRVRNAKKAEALMKQYEGKATDLDGFAKLMSANIDTTQVVFGSNFASKLEDEPAIIGRIIATDPGKVKLWKGENGVYAFIVTKKEKAERVPSKEELNRRYAQQGGGIAANPQAIPAILARATKVTRSLINFY